MCSAAAYLCLPAVFTACCVRYLQGVSAVPDAVACGHLVGHGTEQVGPCLNYAIELREQFLRTVSLKNIRVCIPRWTTVLPSSQATFRLQDGPKVTELLGAEQMKDCNNIAKLLTAVDLEPCDESNHVNPLEFRLKHLPNVNGDRPCTIPAHIYGMSTQIVRRLQASLDPFPLPQGQRQGQGIKANDALLQLICSFQLQPRLHDRCNWDPIPLGKITPHHISAAACFMSFAACTRPSGVRSVCTAVSTSLQAHQSCIMHQCLCHAIISLTYV